MIGDILSVAERLGARLKRVGPNEYAGPCPKCGGRDRFSVNTSKDVWNCRGCGIGGDAIEPARHCLDLSFGEARAFVTGEREKSPRRATEASRRAPAPQQERDTREVALTLWRMRQPVAGSIAERYLRSARLSRADPGHLVFPARARRARARHDRALRDGERTGAGRAGDRRR